MQKIQLKTIVAVLALGMVFGGCATTLKTSDDNPESASFNKHISGQSGIFYTVSGVTFYELKGDKQGKFHTLEGTTYYNFGEGNSGYFQSLDGTAFYNFDDGASGEFHMGPDGTPQYGFEANTTQSTYNQELPKVSDEKIIAQTQQPDLTMQTGTVLTRTALDDLEELPPEQSPSIAESTFYEEN